MCDWFIGKCDKTLNSDWMVTYFTTKLTCIFLSAVAACSLTRKSTGVSIHYNLDCLVLARRSLSSTCAAAGAFHQPIFTWTARSFSHLFYGYTNSYRNRSVAGENICYCKSMSFKKMISGVTRSRGKCSTELTTWFKFAKAKGTKWDFDATNSSFLQLCGATGDLYTFNGVDDLSVLTFTLVSWYISSIFNAVNADLLTFTSRHAACEPRCRLQNNNRGAQGIVVGRDPLREQFLYCEPLYRQIETFL